MNKTTSKEIWKNVKFNFSFVNNYQLQVSNLGSLRSFHPNSEGQIIKGSEVKGYKIYRTKFFKPRTVEAIATIEKMEKSIQLLIKKIKKQQLQKEPKKNIQLSEKTLFQKQLLLKEYYKQDLKSRTIYYHALIHKLVANYFLPKPKKMQVVVGHINHKKTDNRAENLKWMTLEENYAHQQKSPSVIKYKKEKKLSGYKFTPFAKLTENQVVEIKKQLQQNISSTKLASIYHVSSMQIIRIKHGENWKHVKI